jgi:hypothetical protein
MLLVMTNQLLKILIVVSTKPDVSAWNARWRYLPNAKTTSLILTEAANKKER